MEVTFDVNVGARGILERAQLPEKSSHEGVAGRTWPWN